MKWRSYPEYKDSGVEWLGEVPEPWDVKRMRFICRINPNKADLAHLSSSTIVSFLPMEMIGEDGQIDLEETRSLEQVRQGFTHFEDDDIIVAKITPCFENGKGALCKGLLGGIGFGTTELQVLRPNEKVYSAFIFYLTKSRSFRCLGIASMRGSAGQKRITDDFIKDFKVGLPQSDEQRAIATFLDHETAKIDALIAKKERLIELLKEKRAALISHAVTKGLDPSVPMKDSKIKWFGDIPEHWDVRKFSREVHIAEGQIDPEVEPYSSMLLIAPNHIESGTGRLLLKQNAADQGAQSGKYLCRAGEVIYSKIRPALAKVTIAPSDCLCSADMYPMSGGS